MKHLRLIVLVLAAVPLLVVAGVAAAGRGGAEEAAPATAQFHDIEKAKAAGYTLQVFDVNGQTCITQPGEGAMGIHMVNVPLLLDGTIDATKPEALVYEPRNDGTFKLVALEYIVLQPLWTGSQPPALFGRTFDFTNAPNRYDLPPFYALHAWIWKPNPSGLLHPWNPNVNCS